MRKSFVLVGLTVLLAGIPPAHAAAPGAGEPFEPRPVSQPLYGIKPPSEDPETQTHYVEGAGGVDIYVETWLPKTQGNRIPPKKIPTVLVITPYTGFGSVEEPRTLEAVVPRGYAYSQMHVRGTGRSGGCMEQFSSNEVGDAANVIEYLGRDAPWSNGKVGGSGLSYPGISLVMVAGRGEPAKTKYLKAIIAGGVASSQYDYNFFDGVPFVGAGVIHAAAYNGAVSPLPGNDPDPTTYPEKPICVAPVMLDSADSSGDVTPFWADRDHRRGVKNIRAASLIYHGHYDRTDTAIAMAGFFEQIPESTPKHALIGAFGHAFPYRTGNSAWNRADFEDMQVAWFDRYLKGLPSGVEKWPTAQVQGWDGQWRAEPDWPTTGGPVGQLALGPGGALGDTKPTGSTSYVEGLPVSVGGASNGATFTTPNLKRPLHLSGLVVADLWVTLDRPDAHIVALVEALGSNGSVISNDWVFGARSARHLQPIENNHFKQDSGEAPPTGKPLRIQVRFDPGDIIVPAGGRLRLTLGGAAFDPSWHQVSGAASTVEILHDCKHSSVLRFLMPRTKPRFLNVREIGEVGKLKRGPSPRISVSGGGLAQASVCGEQPVRIDLLQP